MKEVLVINPRRKTRRRKATTNRRRNKNGTFAKTLRSKKRPARRKVAKRAIQRKKTMAARKTPRKRRTRVSSIRRAVRRRPRRNPAPRRNRRRATTTRAKAARRVTGALRNVMNVRNVIEAAQGAGGMLAAQWAAKRFADGGGANDSNWTWPNYAWAAAGALGAGLAASMISTNAGKEMFKGGLSLIMYKLVVNQWAERSDFISEQFGASSDAYLPGQTVMGEDGEVYLMGENGAWHEMGGSVVSPGALGETVAPRGHLGEDPYARTFGNDPYADVFNA